MVDAYEFYQPYNWSDRWGSMEGRTSPHKGLDVRASGRQAIPVLRSGWVAAVGRSNSVGGYVTVRTVNGEYDTYCHVISNVGYSPGAGVSRAQNEVIAFAAGYSDDHGVDWTGPHLHLVRHTTVGNWAYWPTLNPEDVILGSGVSGSATSGSTFNNNDRRRRMSAAVRIKNGNPEAGKVFIFQPRKVQHATDYKQVYALAAAEGIGLIDVDLGGSGQTPGLADFIVAYMGPGVSLDAVLALSGGAAIKN